MTAPAKTHSALETLDFEDGILLWGGRKVTDIAENLGRTPFYAYDSGRMTRRVAELRAALPSEIHLHYAMKANPMPEVVAHMVSIVDGLDVASAGELRVALQTGMKRSFQGTDPQLNEFCRFFCILPDKRRGMSAKGIPFCHW